MTLWGNGTQKGIRRGGGGQVRQYAASSVPVSVRWRAAIASGDPAVQGLRCWVCSAALARGQTRHPRLQLSAGSCPCWLWPHRQRGQRTLRRATSSSPSPLPSTPGYPGRRPACLVPCRRRAVLHLLSIWGPEGKGNTRHVLELLMGRWQGTDSWRHRGLPTRAWWSLMSSSACLPSHEKTGAQRAKRTFTAPGPRGGKGHRGCPLCWVVRLHLRDGVSYLPFQRDLSLASREQFASVAQAEGLRVPCACTRATAGGPAARPLPTLPVSAFSFLPWL